MTRRLLTFAIALAWLAGCGGHGTAPTNALPPLANRSLPARTAGNADLPEPPVVKASGGVASLLLIVNENKATGQPEFEFDHMRNVAPTIVVKPGETIQVDLRNNLPSEPPPGSHVMRDDVNLHFHGLGVSPERPQDDVLDVMVKPGKKTRYVIPIPTNQEPGLYWYHPHMHGASTFKSVLAACRARSSWRG